MNASVLSKLLLIAALFLTGTSAAQTWYPLKSPNPDQAHDVAVGYDNDVFIINNNYDVYKWRWKNGSNAWDGYTDYGNPAGGSWVLIGRPPGGAHRIAASYWGGLYAIGRADMKVYLYQAWNNTWASLASPAFAQDVAVGLDGVVYVTTASSASGGSFYSYRFTDNNTWTRFNPNREGIRIATSYFGWNQNWLIWPIVAARSPSHASSYFIPGSGNPYDGSWTALGAEAAFDYGGALDKDPTGPSYQLWMVDKWNSQLYRCASFKGTGAYDCNWTSTNVTAQNVAVGKWNNVVLRTTPSRHVYITFSYGRQ